MRRRGLLAAALVTVTMTTSGCGAYFFRDLGPLPERQEGKPLPADTVVADLTAAFAEEGVTLRRTPRGELPAIRCYEVLRGETAKPALARTLKAGFARARAAHGWKHVDALGPDGLMLRKHDWTASTFLAGSIAPEPGRATVNIMLRCHGARSK